ncbi:septal ring lytic transglycosylase RlpA family protein [Sulfurimonas sp. MAG313]|nr:septal ring lytic transglycosylase RlpA family protein [Sulfurimonas sp. MAG313]
MRPYTVMGKRYYPSVVRVGEKFSGRASWYGPNFHGKKTSNGETYSMWQMTAAHKTLPMNTVVKVTNKSNGRSVVVRVNDRGPFVNTRIIDLSKKAATELNMVKTGTALVRLEILGFNKKGQTKITKTSIQKNLKEKIVGKYALQIGSFSKIEGAISTQERYNDVSKRYKAIIKDIDNGNKRLFKVFLVGFQGEEEARDYKEKYFSGAFIVRE